MTVLLSRSYANAPAGTVITFSTELEASLIAQGLASSAARTATTTGAQLSDNLAGTAAIPAGQSSVVITNRFIDANSHITAKVAQVAADATLLRVERIVCSSGFATIYGTANATATTLVDWEIGNVGGLSIKL